MKERNNIEMKKTFETPEMEIRNFTIEDIVTTSNGGGATDLPDEEL